MFAIRTETVFSAAHALVIQGVREPLHGHDWKVTALLTGPVLDADELLWDFHALHADLEAVVAPMRNSCLNDLAIFHTKNPSAESVARHIGDCLVALLQTRLARYPKTEWSTGLRIASVEVTEAPGCAATYSLPEPPKKSSHV